MIDPKFIPNTGTLREVNLYTNYMTVHFAVSALHFLDRKNTQTSLAGLSFKIYVSDIVAGIEWIAIRFLDRKISG